MSSNVLAIIGAAIRSAREAARLSQEELAHRAGLHRTYIGGVERGERNLGAKNLVEIARALEVPPHELLRGLDSYADRKRK